jgi:hypothetical protein
MFAKAVGYDHPFSNLLRIKLIMDIINNDEVRNVMTTGNTAVNVLGTVCFLMRKPLQCALLYSILRSLCLVCIAMCAKWLILLYVLQEDCCNLNLRRIVQDGSRTILHYFPLHEPLARDALARNWFGWRVYPWLQPLTEVKEYVGEKIGLYFAFTGHYTTWLVSLCAASIAVILYFFVLYVMEGTLVEALNAGVMVPFFCIFVAVWAQLMLEYWKRQQNR